MFQIHCLIIAAPTDKCPGVKRITHFDTKNQQASTLSVSVLTAPTDKCPGAKRIAHFDTKMNRHQLLAFLY